MKQLSLLMILLAIGCSSTPENNSGSNSGTNNSASDAGNNASNGTSNQTANSGSDECAEIGERFITAVRSLGRSCVTSADCKVALRGQVCDCDLAVNSTADTADFDATRGELDGAECSNPFGCPDGQCTNYRRLSDPGELIAHCSDEGECEMLQIVSCTDFEAKAYGSLVPSGSCTDDTDCDIRADLNPCGCGESIAKNYPFLTLQATVEMMTINAERCNLDCQGCAPAGTPACGDDGAGNMVCVAN